MKSAIDLCDEALHINTELKDKGFAEKEICTICELVFRANSTVMWLQTTPQQIFDRSVI